MSIGEALANARHQAGLTVTEVSHRTRIRETIITAIEGDDYSACGGDAYARGYIRSIAAAVGADPRPLIQEYSVARLGPRPLAGDPAGPSTPVEVPRHRRLAGLAASTGRHRRHRPAWAAALGVTLLAGLAFAGYLLANTGHGPGPAAGTHRAALHHLRRAGEAPSAAATRGRQAAPAPAVTAPAAAPPRPLTPASAAAFGPAGSHGDNGGLAFLAIDGNPATAWRTDWYTTAKFGNLYRGTGLLVDMGRRVTITGARIALGPPRGASLQLRVGTAPALASLPAAARAANAGGVVHLRLSRPAHGRYVLIWFTSLPPGPAGAFQASVYDLRLAGRA